MRIFFLNYGFVVIVTVHNLPLDVDEIEVTTGMQ
jgi:hypothetical protein